jgi:hypothetical protein
MQWTAACAFGGVLLGLAIQVGEQFAALSALPYPFWIAIVLATPGLAFAIPQWLVLHRSIGRGGRWLVTTVLGLGAGILVAFTMAFPLASALGAVPARDSLVGALVGAIMGGVLGAMQAPLLCRAKGIAEAEWIAASALSGVVFLLLAGAMVGTLGRPPVEGLSVAGLAYGGITGVVVGFRGSV